MNEQEQAGLEPGAWADQTVLHPLGLAAILILGAAMLIVPRRYSVWPLIIMACFIAPAQRIVIAGLDFNLLRIMVVFGWIRLFIKNETAGFVWRPIDTVIIAWASAATLTYTILMGTGSAFVNRLGVSLDGVGTYFLLRCLLRNWDDLDNAIRGVILVSIPVAAAFLIENQTGRNAFAVFGGVPFITDEREGRLRCQGAFPHPIMAGCFWASLMPLIAVRWWAGPALRTGVVVGLGTSSIIVLCCASSTPVMAVLFGIGGMAMFFMRHHMRAIRWSLVALLLLLHLTMKAPVWHLISRINVVSGSTGWHRFHLINSAVEEFPNWWLLGTTTTEDWGAGLRDVTNQYVLEGVRGGLITLLLFIAVLALAFGEAGRLWRRWAASPFRLATAWALGVSLFVHTMNFLAVSYFGQTVMAFILPIAAVTSLAAMPHRAFAFTPGQAGFAHATRPVRRIRRARRVRSHCELQYARAHAGVLAFGIRADAPAPLRGVRDRQRIL
jgi:hypothetical protein